MLAWVRAARAKKGERIVDNGAGDGDGAEIALSSSSRYMSERWNVKLAGTRISSGLDNGIMIKSVSVNAHAKTLP